MGVKRRNFCAVTAGALASLAGCAGVDNLANEAAEAGEAGSPSSTEIQIADEVGGSLPDPTVEALIAPESELVSIDQPEQSTFTVTVQNTGDDGNIAIALFWQLDENATAPDSVSFLQEGYRQERQQERYFNADERRTVEMTASPPEDAVGYQFITQPASHGAKITNRGDAGRIDAVHTYTSTVGLTQEKRKTVHVDADATTEVVFDTIVDPGVEWEITAEPARDS